VAGTPVPISEQLDLTDDLPAGEGNPNDYSVAGPANAGGAGFALGAPMFQALPPASVGSSPTATSPS
jgi:hypothetical protein